MDKWILRTSKRSWDFIHFIGKLFGLWKTLRNNIEKDNVGKNNEWIISIRSK